MIEHPSERPSERPPLSPERFGQFLEHLGLGANEAARQWSLTPRRIHRFLSGEEPVPVWLEVMLMNVTALRLLLPVVVRHFQVTETRPVGFGPLQQLAEDAIELATGKADNGDSARSDT